MSNFYGQYIGFGSGTSGGGLVWYGTIGAIVGGYLTLDTIDYVTIQTTGTTASDWGNMVSGRRGIGHTSNGTVGVVSSGRGSGYDFSTHMDYFTIATPATTAQDFGNLTDSTYAIGSTQDGTYGIRWGGYPGEKTQIDYWTQATPADAQNFGDLGVAGGAFGDGVNDATYGLCSGIGNVSGGYEQDLIQVMTIANVGSDASDWGADLHFGTYHFGTVSSAAGRGLMSGGWGFSATQNQIQYVTIASAVNGSDFGNMLSGSASNSGVNDATRGVFTRGYLSYTNMEYVEMDTAADAQDFGDLSVGRSYTGGCSGS